MSGIMKSKLKFLLILPVIAGIVYFGAGVSDFDILESMDTEKWMLEQFAINYDSMMTACSADDLTSEELQSCLDAFVEVREFCTSASADQCGDENMVQLEKKLLDV